MSRKSRTLKGKYANRAKDFNWQRKEYMNRMGIDSAELREIESHRVVLPAGY